MHGSRSAQDAMCGEMKTSTVSVRITPDIKKLWQKWADREGMAVSEYVRHRMAIPIIFAMQSTVDNSKSNKAYETYKKMLSKSKLRAPPGAKPQKVERGSMQALVNLNAELKAKLAKIRAAVEAVDNRIDEPL